MTRTIIFAVLAASLLVAFGWSAGHPGPPRHNGDAAGRSTPEKPFPSGAAAASRVMPDSYRVLLTRCIFARDGRASVVRSGSGGPDAPGLWVGPPGTEATLAFRGVTLSDGSYTAFIEDTTGGGIRRFSRGDVIAAGRIEDITLDRLDYLSAGKLTRVVLGQNLAGAPLPAPALPPATQPAAPLAEGNGQRGPGRRPPVGPAPATEAGPAPVEQ